VRNLWIQLFARAQGQYLFPNSSQFEGKHPLSDIKLCAWWQRILSLVALDIVETCKSTTLPPLGPSVSPSTANTVQAFYVLPGYSQLEAENFLKSGSSEVAWEYGHPYNMPKAFQPCPSETHSFNLGHYIPYFDDDPKSRFLDEIAYTTNGEVKSPVRKRARTVTSAVGAIQRKDADADGARERDRENGKEKDDRPLGELGKVTPDEFWERMSFRQECVMGAVTGFFTLVVSAKDNDEGEGASKSLSNHEATSPLEPRPGHISSQIYKRVLTALTTGVEFSTAERAIKSTETLESTIKRLCDGIAPPSHSQRSTTPEPKERTNPSTPPRSSKTPVVPDITPNPFPEPVASLEMYQSHIYGTVSVTNAVVGGATRRGGEGASTEGVVTVLTARKKQKRGR
jgi:regulator of Ty1 transposition protein 109